MTRSFVRIAFAGAAVAALAMVGGRLGEYVRLGSTDRAAVERVEFQLRARIAASADTLATIAARAASARDLIETASRDPDAARRLFDALEGALPVASDTTGVTIYDTQPVPTPIAWAGRVSDLPRQRLEGGTAVTVAGGAPGPRLIRTEPVVDRDRAGPSRIATIVAEQALGERQSVSPVGDTFVLTGLSVPVSVHSTAGPLTGSPYAFAIPATGGDVLLSAEVAPHDLAEARARWRRWTFAAALSAAGVTLLACALPLIELRRRARSRGHFVAETAGLLFVLAGCRAILWLAAAAALGRRSAAAPLDLLLNASLVAAVVWLALDSIERRRLVPPRPRLLAATTGTLGGLLLLDFAAGVGGMSVLWAYERLLHTVVSESTLDLLHFSLHPLNGTRLALAFAILLLHAGIVWSAAIAVRGVAVVWRVPRTVWYRVAGFLAWGAGLGVTWLLVRRAPVPLPNGPVLSALAAAGLCAWALVRPRPPMRRASQATRLLALYLALLVPAIAMYPSLHAFTVDGKEQLVARTFGPRAASQREDLQRELNQTLDVIDAMTPPAVLGIVETDNPTTDQAFEVWSKTPLAESRLTSAVELYAADGRLASRFALIPPEYVLAPRAPAACRWNILEEPSPFGLGARHVLRASRAICSRDRHLGEIVVRVMLDYRTLPFIASQSPYLQALNPEQRPPAETAPGRDVELVVYGWSRAPLYASGPTVWSLSDPLFNRLLRSRAPFWTTLLRDGSAFRVHFLNDRGGVYALGYPIITWVGHLMNIAELVILTGALFVLLIGGATLFNALTSRTPASGRALLREVRSSFYRKLFLAFVLVAVVPVVILALGTRTYFANRFSAGVEQDAVKTVTVAQRLVEDYATLEQRGTSALAVVDDPIMVLVGRAVDEDVNLFNRTRLQATSARDLFASGLLTTRTPAAVYRSIVLERLPTYVGFEATGTFPYLIAAAPVRAGARDGMVTVPLTLRQQEIELQIDELDRSIWAASVLFVLLGAGFGYWMAERIADPVSRLSRATRRIARGDLDARIAATSSDELRRLVEDFNRMAGDLKRQRADLERTQRLEAWAEMARQVAHDIKNPLTPIQLSAEHARRVNIDSGRPLSPVLDECVDAILTQVRLLRQISAEFSSFASSPTPRPEPTELGALVEQVVEPYRTGLSGRIGIEVRLDRELPLVSIDRTLFARALTNIVENALHAMPGGGTLTMTAAVEGQTGAGSPGDSSWVVVHITDTGVGMDRESLQKVFEPYFSTKTTGTGLGLTIAKRNVELNRGTIAVESQRGAGTTVTIRLPAA